MNELSLGWMESGAKSRRTAYRRALGASLTVQAAMALYALIAPLAFSRLLELPPPSPAGWVRAWGVLLLLVTTLYVPAFMEPVRYRWGNVIGIAGRCCTALLYLVLGSGFLWLALIDGCFAILLAILYFRLFRAELMSRP